MNIIRILIILLAFIEISMSLKTKLEYDVCVEENKCNKVDFYD